MWRAETGDELSMEIRDSFLEAEVRDGFYVPSVMKQAWAAEMDVLSEIDRICKKHDIPYFSDWGTLLGTVRHKGFIPWDDDLDITMKRKDYERFLEVAPKELPEGFEVFTYANHPDFWYFLARVVAKNRICFEEEHLKRFHGFPYIAGVDIFVLDYVCEDEEKEEYRAKLAKYIIAAADEIAEGRLTGKKANETLDDIEKLCKIKLLERQDLHTLRVQLYQQAEKLFAMFSEDESKTLTRMMPNGLNLEKNFRLPKEYYDKAVWLPYEGIKMPVPIAYDEMLRKRYGDYMKLVRNCSGHNYPFFETQKKQLQAVLDFEMPGYKYTEGEAVRKDTKGAQGSLKELLAECLVALEDYVAGLKHLFVSGGSAEDALQLLQESQQLAIDMGNLIESCKGEGHVTIETLEAYCEQIFMLAQDLSESQLEKLPEALYKVKESIDRNILKRKEVVFLPSKASEWGHIESVWRAAIEDADCDVYVVPIPYFYKEYDGRLRDMQYEGELFPKYVPIEKYDEFDFGLHHPETIFIQNAYDEYDAVMSVHNFFYSGNLRQFTEQLVYIPPFVLEEFSKDSYREYFNMQFYCTVPGVVRADKVLVQSENMRNLYIEKLTEFAGESTRDIWKQKVLGLGSPMYDVQGKARPELPKEWQTLMMKADGTTKKVLMYYVSVSSFMQYGERILEKMQEVFCTVEKEQERLILLWKSQPEMKEILEQLQPEFCEKYIALEKEFVSRKKGILDCSLSEDAVSISDAYYGDSSSLVQKFRNAGKPVMIQQV